MDETIFHPLESSFDCLLILKSQENSRACKTAKSPNPFNETL